jgi:hypothetical protein
MSMNVSDSTPLKDVLYAFSMARPIPNAELLDDFARRYPTHAAALTDFAVSIVLDLARGGDDEEAAHAIEPTVSKAVSRAMSRFQNKLFEVQQSRTTGATLAATQSDVVNPFAPLDRKGFRHLAEHLNCNAVFVQMLRDREIEPATIPPRFTQKVSDELSVPMELVAAHFAAQPQVYGGQYYKSMEKPRASTRVSFEDAVKKSGLTEEQQTYLLGLLS